MSKKINMMMKSLPSAANVAPLLVKQKKKGVLYAPMHLKNEESIYF